jgi:hypothetical protein
MSTRDRDERLGDDVELNPQPIPPGHQDATRHGRPGDQVELNPQPIPPGRGLMGALRRLLGALRRMFGGRAR